MQLLSGALAIKKIFVKLYIIFEYKKCSLINTDFLVFNQFICITLVTKMNFIFY